MGTSSDNDLKNNFVRESSGISNWTVRVMEGRHKSVPGCVIRIQVTRLFFFKVHRGSWTVPSKNLCVRDGASVVDKRDQNSVKRPHRTSSLTRAWGLKPRHKSGRCAYLYRCCGASLAIPPSLTRTRQKSVSTPRLHLHGWTHEQNVRSCRTRQEEEHCRRHVTPSLTVPHERAKHDNTHEPR